jgi:hypothetical protein
MHASLMGFERGVLREWKGLHMDLEHIYGIGLDWVGF